MINPNARNEARTIRHTACELGGFSVMQSESGDGLVTYNRFRPEYYGLLSHIVIDSAEKTITSAESLPPYGMTFYNGKPVSYLNSWEDFQLGAYNTLRYNADRLYFHAPEPSPVVTRLQTVMHAMAAIEPNSYKDPEDAIRDGILTAVSSMWQIMIPMASYLKTAYPSMTQGERIQVITSSPNTYMQLSFANIFQLDAIGKVSGAFCSQDFQLTNGSLQLRCGKLADFPVESHAALRIGVTDGTAEHATLSDITFPYAHLGCPITLKPKTVTGLWQWGSHAAATAELL